MHRTLASLLLLLAPAACAPAHHLTVTNVHQVVVVENAGPERPRLAREHGGPAQTRPIPPPKNRRHGNAVSLPSQSTALTVVVETRARERRVVVSEPRHRRGTLGRSAKARAKHATSPNRAAFARSKVPPAHAHQKAKRDGLQAKLARRKSNKARKHKQLCRDDQACLALKRKRHQHQKRHHEAERRRAEDRSARR
jgi:hypothetical protein